MRFVDSAQFLPASLETLVQNLVKACDDKHDRFVHTRRHLGDNDLLFKKGIFPYEYFDSVDKFDETCLPPIQAFYSHLKDQGISAEEYAHAQNVWNEFDCKSFKDYHDLYLKMDVLLLADVFQDFRLTCLANYRLDCAHYLTLPSFA